MTEPIAILKCWATSRGDTALPVLWGTRALAEEEADTDESVYRVEVHVLRRVTKREAERHR